MTNDMKKGNYFMYGQSDVFTVSVSRRFIMLFCMWVLCYLISAMVMGFVMFKGITPAKVRICLVLQDVIVFVLPAVATAVLVCRRPAELLLLRKPGGLWPFVMVVFLLMSMIPAMNALISWNQALTLPESLSWLYDWMVSSERSASETMSMVTGSTTVGGLIITLLIVGVLAGLSEELFFRGGVQRLLTTASVNPHIAIWLTAFLFSAIHLQFFGFFPRLILGAVFGYLAYWSQSIWMPITAHILNNSLAVVAIWMKNRTSESIELDTIGSSVDSAQTLFIVIVSVLFSVFWLLAIRRRCLNQNN